MYRGKKVWLLLCAMFLLLLLSGCAWQSEPKNTKPTESFLPSETASFTEREVSEITSEHKTAFPPVVSAHAQDNAVTKIPQESESASASQTATQVCPVPDSDGRYNTAVELPDDIW